MPGYYKNWGREHAILEYIQFAPLEKTLSVLNNGYGRFSYHVKVERNLVFDLLAQLSGTHVVGPRKRFPNEYYVNLSHGAFASEIRAIFSRLDFGGRNRNQCIASYNHNKCSYYRRVQRLIQMAHNHNPSLYGIFDRVSFERHHQLEWIDDKQKK
ncbi:unnamed protein product [Xylocopa violacea]|uniref:Homing endonuclease LAGLIDADG domain-containing protein n=1 Tax=Xylocopa violacea TaxID=135666 RepID=A0ABP1P7U3_XYLVO